MLQFSAIVLPISCPLGSVADRGGKSPVLLKVDQSDAHVSQKPSRDSVLQFLLDTVQQRIGKILNHDQYGNSHFQASMLLEGYSRKLLGRLRCDQAENKMTGSSGSS